MSRAKPTTHSAENSVVQILRLVSETAEGEDVLELHPRLTVISSADVERRRSVFERVYRALRGEAGQHVETVTEYGDRITAFRPANGKPTLVDSVRNAPVAPGTRGLGLVAQLNSPDSMAAHLRTLHVSKRSLLDRVIADADMIALAKTPIDQVWGLANNIQADREILNHTRDRGTDLSAAAEERQVKEEAIAEVMAQRADAAKRVKALLIGGASIVAVAGLAYLTSGVLLAVVLGLIGLGVAAGGYWLQRTADEEHGAMEFEDTELGLQVGRIDELFDSHSLGRKQREAQENLSQSMRLWSDLAGSAQPEVLIKERTRIEELAGYIRLIDSVVEPGGSTADVEALYGLASLLAELSRRFPAERVPLLIDDVFADLDPSLHGVLRELIVRASHRRQVLLESADIDVCRWAAVDAVAGDALLITDQDVTLPEPAPVDVEPLDDDADDAEEVSLDESVATTEHHAA